MATQNIPSSSTTLYISLTAVITVLLAIGAYLYVSGTGNDIAEWVAEKYFKAEAKAEEKALEKAGATRAEGFLEVEADVYASNRKDQLKKNPVVSSDELNEIQGGLGDEAAKEFGKGGIGEGIGKALD
ncbi:MAG: hypothetical protein Q9195_003322 [Heterodermia aff. obscurata]